MSFQVSHSFDYHFTMLLDKLEKKYGTEMFELEGIDQKQLDIAKFTNRFLQTKTTSDISIDANANVDDMSILSWNYEHGKPLAKLNSLYHIWSDALRKHGIKRANKMIEAEISGAIRIHDLHGWLMPYCWAASIAPIVNEGMPWVKNIRVKPVKHFDTLISNSIKYLYNLSTQCVGAIALPDFLAYAEYFIRKDFGEEWYNDERSVRCVRQGFQNWIYGVNDKARGNQSPFTNVSVFDKYWREAMFGKHTNPDFSTCNLENLKRVQRTFVDVLIEEQVDNPFTFPVMTACQLKDPVSGEIMDKDWLDWIAGITVKNKLMNFYTSETCDSLSSCLEGNELIRVINDTTGKEEVYTIKNFIGLFVSEDGVIDKKYETGYSIKTYNFTTNTWENEKIVGLLKKIHDKMPMVKLTVDGKDVVVTYDHIFTVREISSGEIMEVSAKEIADNIEKYEIGLED